MRIASLIFFFLMLFCRSSSSFPFFPRPRPPFPRPPPPRPPPPLLLVDSLLLPHLAPSRSFTQTNTLLFSFCLRLYSPFFHSYFFINLASSSPSLPPSCAFGRWLSHVPFSCFTASIQFFSFRWTYVYLSLSSLAPFTRYFYQFSLSFSLVLLIILFFRFEFVWLF